MPEQIDPVRIFLDTWAEMIAPGGGFAMNEIEAMGRPTRVFASAPPNMRAVWDNTVGHADRTYLVFEDERFTYGEVHAQARALAHHLATEYGIGAESRVGLSMRNYPEWVITYWAVVSLGATVVGLNAWWTSPEMDFALRETRPTVLIVDGERLERLVPILDGLRDGHALAVIATRVDGDLPDTVAAWADAIGGPAPDVIPPVDIDPDADVTIFFTSGTTGFPKGAQITHRGSVHNLLHMIFMAMVGSASQSKINAARGKDAATSLLTEPVFLAPTPLFHVTALNCLLHPLTMAGGTVVLMHRWDATRALELIEREHVTTLSGVPTMSREILSHPDWKTRDTSSLVGLAGGGAPVPPDLVEKIGASLPTGGASTGYGLTETSGIVTANSAACYVAKPASCGPVVPTVDAKLGQVDVGNVVRHRQNSVSGKGDDRLKMRCPRADPSPFPVSVTEPSGGDVAQQPGQRVTSGRPDSLVGHGWVRFGQ